MDIRKDDIVAVISGADKGKRGRALEVFPAEGKLRVEKARVVKRHQRPTQQNQQGGIIEKEAKIDRSNVALVCPKCDQLTKIRARRVEDVDNKFNRKRRFCSKCSELIDSD